MQPAPADDKLMSGSSPLEAAPAGVTAADVPTGGCPVGHAPPPVPKSVQACPVAQNTASLAGCPAARRSGAASRSKADLVVRRVLRIPERPAGTSSGSAYSSFQRSMFISAVRCTLTYVVFPFVAPAVGFATGVGPLLGMIIGSFAMVCDVFTIRRFFAVDHRWRWPVSTVAFSVICLLAVLMVQDIGHLMR